MNIEGRGEYVQYYTSGKKRMTFDSGYIRYYEDDTNNTLLWELGKSGSIVTTTLDIWEEIYLIPIYNNTNIKVTNFLTGTKYKRFRAGKGSSYSSYNGLTVLSSVPDNTLPSAVTAAQKIPGTDYTTLNYTFPGPPPVITLLSEEGLDDIYMRSIDTYQAGYIISTSEIYFNGSGMETDSEGNLIP